MNSNIVYTSMGPSLRALYPAAGTVAGNAKGDQHVELVSEETVP